MLVEPPVGILGDIWRRRVLIVAGGFVFAASTLLTATSAGFWMLLLSFALFFPASGAFVSLSQATLMDWEPGRREQNMSRWAFAGSAGAALGPLALAGTLAAGGGWRGLYVAFTLLAVLLSARVRRFPMDGASPGEGERSPGIREGLRAARQVLRSPAVLRWLGLLEASNLMMDVLFSYLSLYLVEVSGLSPQTAALAVTLWTVAGLVGDFLVIPLLERVSGLAYLRISAVVVGVLFAAFLMVHGLVFKLMLLVLLGLGRAGWYPILKARYYEAMPGQSGTAMAVDSMASVVGGVIPLGLGGVAQAAGLGPALWLLLAGPVALLAGLPREKARCP